MRDILAGASALPGANREEPQMRNLLLDIHPWWLQQRGASDEEPLVGHSSLVGQSSGPSRGTSHLRAIKRDNCIMHLVDH